MMETFDRGRARRRLMAMLSRYGSPALALALSVAVTGLLWVSYRSIEQWQRSSQLLAEERTQVMLTLLMAALNRDMRGAQVSVLLPLELEDVTREPSYDLRDTFAAAFARFPYVESFFLLKRDQEGRSRLDTFNRPERPPAWDAGAGSPEPYPVVFHRDPPAGQILIDALLPEAEKERRFMVFERSLGDGRYQLVAKLLRRDPSHPPFAIVGFTVNVAWAREHYFSDLAGEVSRIGDPGGSIALVIEDDLGNEVVRTAAFDEATMTRKRDFVPLFFDPVMLPALAPSTAPRRPWAVRVGAASVGVLTPARRATRGAYTTLAVAAVASVVGMLLTMRALRSRARLTAMQSDFVCTVTHELKTPVAFIRLLGETLSKGRYESSETIRQYARILSQEAWRLTRLIDNILALSRVTEATQYSAESIEIAEMLEEVLSHFRPQLAERDFEVDVRVEPDSIRIMGDRTMIAQAVDNLVANAIKYSTERRVLAIRACVHGEWVRLEVEDRGVGIREDDLPRVFDKFFRGRSGDAADIGGSGLGLAIVKRVAEKHGGRVQLSSVPGEGTCVQLLLPADPAVAA